ncbi:Outer membrane protein beta-barrel domain-containing protein [Sphingomonas laterariae]|uniref:Outer membrane protein beta-barrel domain-containing protein n=1 Tax=Edaphosphingomonas laterariae TaxID=861865 RepID=A0A239JFK4_9SPHN|nr:outer membrane beta-barrel protein [Sphingomonas laterariae]SNT04382.1 Outer membrane protein beta-barrel domain-containing protein [Sphingomonas laterariae]
MRGSCQWTAATAILISGWIASPAAAQALQDKYWIEAAAYWPRVDTNVRVASTGSQDIGTDIDLESDLDLDKNEVLPSVFVGARLGGNFSVSAEYYALTRKGERAIERDITFRDVVYPVGASIATKFDTDVYRLTLGYAFVRNDNFELGASLGLHATKFKIELRGEGNVGGVGGATQVRGEDVLAPLPTIGLFTAFEVTPGVTLNARVDYLSLSIGDYDGRLLNAQAGAAYRFTDNVGIGVMYRYVDYRVDVEKDRWTGRLAYKFKGPSVFLQLGF